MAATTFTQDPEALTRFLKTMLFVLLGIVIVSLISDLLQFQLVNSGRMGIKEAQANDARQQAIGIVQLLAYVVTAILFLKWIYRANLNVRGFGAQDLKFTPGWSIGYYFIPILNLFRPYRAMKEIWRASKNPGDWQNQAAPSLLGWWWALFLISGVLGQASFRMSLRANTIPELSTATMVSIAAGLADIPLCLVAVKLVTQIFRMQQDVIGTS